MACKSSAPNGLGLFFRFPDGKAFSIKVGYGSTQANYYLKGVGDVRDLLEALS